MADPLSEYQKQMMARGLGGIFQEEGPRLGSEYVAPGGFPTASRLAGLYKSRLSPKSGILYGDRKDDVIDKKIASIFEKDRKNRELNFNPDDIVKQIQTSPLVQPISSLEQRKLGEKVAEKIEAMPDDSDIFSSALDEYAASIAPQLISGPKKDELTLSSEIKKQDEKLKESEKNVITEDEMLAASGALDATYSDDVAPKTPKDNEIKDLFMSGVGEYMKVLGKEVPPEINREEALEKYKKEFSEATGIDISGKPDTSAALMSLGLALMQNRAGSGFNVGRILSEVGKAGEKALPMFQEAKKEAKAATAAAGKYALQMIKSDEDARDAIKASNAALKKELLLKDLEFKRDRQLLIDEAVLSGDEEKVTEALKNTEQKTIKVGAKEVKIGLGQDIDFGGRSVFTSPEFDARTVADAYKKTGQGLDLLRQMEGLLFRLKDQGEGSFGGTALQGALENVISIGNSMGMNLEYPSGDDVALTKQLDVLQKQVLSRFKKFIAQETGNGISNVDVKDIKAALGNFETFEDIDKAIMSVSTMQDLFLSSQNTLDPIVDMFMDRKSYRGNEVGTESYENVVKMFSESFGNVSLIEPTIVEGPGGQKIIDYDIRTGV